MQSRTLNEAVMEILLLLLLHDREERVGRTPGRRRSHNIRYLGIKRGSNRARTMTVDGLIDLEETRSGSYLLGIHARLTEKGQEIAEQVSHEFVPAWVEARVNYWAPEPETGEAVRFVDDGLVVAEGTLITRFNGGGGVTDDGRHRVLHLLRPLEPGSRAKIREIQVFHGSWQSCCPCIPYGDGVPFEHKSEKGAR